MERTSFYLVLSSDSSLSEFPQNSLSKFSNILPSELLIDNTWSVSLQSIIIAAKVNVEEICVHLKQINKKITINDHDTVLRTFIREKREKKTYFEAIRREYYKLTDSILNNFDILLTDSDNKQLQLSSDQPTFIKLKFKKMSRNQNFVLNCSSSASLDHFPLNSASSFSNSLEYPIQFDNNGWYMALTKISLPSNIAPLIQSGELWFSIYFELSENTLSDEHYNTQQIHFSSTQSNAMLRRRVRELIFEITSGYYGCHFSDDDGIMSISCIKKFRMRISSKLHFLLSGKLEKSDAVYLDPEHIQNPGFPEKYVLEVGTDIDVQRLKASAIFLYCNIIEYVYVGDKQTQLLKLLPAPTTLIETKRHEIESQHLDFIRIAARFIPNITFELKYSDGSPVSFLEKNSDVKINVLFIKK